MSKKQLIQTRDGKSQRQLVQQFGVAKRQVQGLLKKKVDLMGTCKSNNDA